MDNGLTASDVALMTNNGFGDGMGFMWIFALLVLAGGGFGGWGNNSFANAIGYENLATSNEVQRGFDNQNAMANQREILSAVTNGTAQSVAATNATYINVRNPNATTECSANDWQEQYYSAPADVITYIGIDPLEVAHPYKHEWVVSINPEKFQDFMA